MAERQRFATRMIQPGNPMQFSPSVPQQKGDSTRLKQMESMANQLLKFSDSFAGAFKAKFKADEAELINQQKIEKQIKKEQATEQDIVGRMFRKRNGAVRQEQLDAMLSPLGQEGYFREHFEIELKNRNLGHKAKSKRIADRIFKAYQEEVRTGTIKNVPLEKYASIHLEHLRSQNIDEFFSIDKTGNDGTVYKEMHPIAAQVLKEKGGLNLTPYYEAIADLDAQQQKQNYNAVKRQYVQDKVVKLSPPLTHQEFMFRVSEAQRAFAEGQFYTKQEIINEYIRDVEERLVDANSSTDPVFNSLNFITTSKDGVSVLNSGYESEKSNVKYLSQDFKNLKQKLTKRKKALEKEEFETAEKIRQKEEREGIRGADDQSRTFMGEINGAEDLVTLEFIADNLEAEVGLGTYEYGASTGYAVHNLYKLITDKKATLQGKPLISINDADGETRTAFNEFNIKLDGILGDTGNLPDVTDNDIKKLRQELLQYSDYTEAVEKSSKTLRDIKKERGVQREERQKQVDKVFKDFIAQENKDILNDHRTKLFEFERDPNTTLKDLETFGDQLKPLIATLPESQEKKDLLNSYTQLVKVRSEQDSVATYEENGFDAKLSSELALYSIKQKDGRFKEQDILNAISKLRSNNHILVKDKGVALKNYFDALELISGNAENANFVKLRKEIYKNSRNKDKLTELIQSERFAAFPDLLQEAQSYVDNLDNQNANEAFFWKKWNADKDLYDARLKERIKREDNIREMARKLQLEDRDEQRLFEEQKAYFNRLYNEAQKANDRAEQKRIKEEERKYNEDWYARRRDRTEKFQKEMREQRRQDNIELRELFETKAETKADKKRKLEQKAINKSGELMEAFVSATTDAQRQTVIQEWKSESVQKIFTDAKNNVIYKNMAEFFTNSQTARTKEDRSQANLEISNQSKADRNKAGGDLIQRAEDLLAMQNPDFNEIRDILSSMTTVQDWNSDNGKLMSRSVSTVSDGKRMEMFAKMRVRKTELRNKNDDKADKTAEAKIHIDFENQIRFFPFTKNPGETDGEFRERQELQIGLFYSDLATNYEQGKISKPLFNQLTKDIEDVQTDLEKRKFIMLKSSPYSPIKVYEDRIRDTIAKNPGGFYFQLGGAGTFLGAEQHRMHLYSDMITYYKGRVNEEYNTNELFRTDLNEQNRFVKELYTEMTENIYAEQIASVNDIFGSLTQDKTGEAQKKLKSLDERAKKTTLNLIKGKSG